MIKTGFGNTLGNKGAVAVSVNYMNYNLLFISSHLAAGQKNTSQRNQDFNRINYELDIHQKDDDSLKANNKKTSTSQEKASYSYSSSSVTDMYDICIWLGDFNYRIDLQLEEIHNLLLKSNLDHILEYDQFYKQIEDRELDINGFYEPRINFYPTYKFVKETDDYDIQSKQPGWTDRIIYKSKVDSQMILLSYNWIPYIKISDHKPVSADFIFNIEKSNSTINSMKGEYSSSKSKTCTII